jgi:hypothetical protein
MFWPDLMLGADVCLMMMMVMIVMVMLIDGVGQAKFSRKMEVSR